jgi:hypothetical protein
MISEAANIACYIPVDIILVLGIRGTHPMRGNDTMLVTTLLASSSNFPRSINFSFCSKTDTDTITLIYVGELELVSAILKGTFVVKGVITNYGCNGEVRQGVTEEWWQWML